MYTYCKAHVPYTWHVQQAHCVHAPIHVERDWPTLVPFRKETGILYDVPPPGNQAGSCLHASERQSMAVSKIEGMAKDMQQINSDAKTRVRLSSLESEWFHLTSNLEIWNLETAHIWKNTHAALQLPFSITTTCHSTQYLCHLRALSGATCTTAACLSLLAKWWIRSIWVALLGISSADCLIAGCINNY